MKPVISRVLSAVAVVSVVYCAPETSVMSKSSSSPHLGKNPSDKELKDAGNKHFGARNYDMAIDCYTKVRMMVKLHKRGFFVLEVYSRLEVKTSDRSNLDFLS